MGRIELPTSPLPRECSTTEPHGRYYASTSRTGAGEGNRTLVVSLEGFCSTIELHPHGPLTIPYALCADILGGGGWIRTNVGVSQQIYSLPPLATRAPLRRELTIMGVHRTLVKHIRKIIFILFHRTDSTHPTPALARLRQPREDRRLASTSSSDPVFSADLHLC